MVKFCVFFAEHTEFLNIVQTNLGFKGLMQTCVDGPFPLQTGLFSVLNKHICIKLVIYTISIEDTSSFYV
jgi:hypothetical protein